MFQQIYVKVLRLLAMSLVWDSRLGRVMVSVFLLGAGLVGAAGAPVIIQVDTTRPGREISPRMVGLSYETSLMLPGTNGVHYFRPDNEPLVRLFRTLGVKSLRIGGNSVDAPPVPTPSEADVASLFDFARAAGVKVIYSVRLEEATNRGSLPPIDGAANVRAAAAVAGFIHEHYAGVLDCFAIGNEPGYFKNYALYSQKWRAIHDAIQGVFPGARFCGPDQNPSPELDRKLARDFGDAAGGLVLLTQHSYPLGCAYRNSRDPEAKVNPAKLIPVDPTEAMERMLSPATYLTYQKIYRGIAGALTNGAAAYRLSECNSFWYSGLAGVSDRYGAALWGADFLNWWAEHGADGLNFHTGDRTGGSASLPARYSAFVSSANGYEARPLSYGLKLFDLGGYGRVLPVTVQGQTNQNLVAYARRTADGGVCVTVINKTHGALAQAIPVRIQFDPKFASAKSQIICLRGRNDNLAGESADVTLGGARLAEDGSWAGQWQDLPPNDPAASRQEIILPPASAAVVRFDR